MDESSTHQTVTRRDALRAVGGVVVGGTGVSVSTGESVAQSSSESWSQFGYDAANTGYAPENTGPVEGVKEAWHFETDDSVYSSPAVVGDTVYVGSRDGAVYALETESGSERWRFEARDDIATAPAVANGTIYFTDWGGGLYAVDAESGEERWRLSGVGGLNSSPTVTDGMVYVGGVNAIDAETGKREWYVDTGNVGSAPAVADGTVYVSSRDSSVYAIDADSGAKRWSFETTDAVHSSPAVANETVYVGSNDQHVYAIDAESGTERWRFATGDRVGAAPSVTDRTVYVGSEDFTVYALDADSGDKRWQFDSIDAVSSSPAVADDTVYVGSTYEVVALDSESGTERWRFETEDEPIDSSPSVANGTVYVGSWDNNVYALTAGSSTVASPSADFPVLSGSRRVLENDWPLLVAGGVVGMGGYLWHRWPDWAGESDVERDPGVPASDRTESGTVTTEATTPDSGSGSPPSSEGSPATGAKTRRESDRQRIADELDTLRDDLNRATESDSSATMERRLAEMRGRLSELDDQVAEHGFEGLREEITALDAKRANLLADATQAQRSGSPDHVPRAPSASISYDDLSGEEPIGGGGNADVTEATLPTPDGDVTLAIKRPRMQGTLHADAVDRIIQEAETWDKLDDHDHVVGVIDYGAEPLPWIAMEYMDAGDLGKRAGKLDFDQARWTAVAITKAVRHAHRHGVAHLDLKPANVLFRSVEDSWNVPKVADWGLSKHLLEHSKSVDGLSPQYAAPEQFDEAYGATDDLTDVYQLGAVLYELFTGRPPFEGKPAKTMHQVLHERPTPPSEVADVPEALDDVLGSALAKEKHDRYESVLYLRDALQDIRPE